MSSVWKVGDIGYMVLDDPEIGPFTCRMECVYVSPKGQSVHWREMDTVRRKTLKRCHVKSKINRAVYAYQRRQVVVGSRMMFSGGGEDLIRKAVENIVQAESLKEKDPLPAFAM